MLHILDKFKFLLVKKIILCTGLCCHKFNNELQYIFRNIYCILSLQDKYFDCASTLLLGNKFQEVKLNLINKKF